MSSNHPRICNSELGDSLMGCVPQRHWPVRSHLALPTMRLLENCGGLWRTGLGPTKIRVVPLWGVGVPKPPMAPSGSSGSKWLPVAPSPVLNQHSHLLHTSASAAPTLGSGDLLQYGSSAHHVWPWWSLHSLGAFASLHLGQSYATAEEGQTELLILIT